MADINRIERENTHIDDIESEVVNLIFTAIDQSGSMDCFVKDMQHSLNEFKVALENSKEADTVLVSRCDYSDSNVSISGYKTINQFPTNYRADGGTPLYDAIVIGTEKLIEYMNHLKQNGLRTKAVFSIFSDGEDNNSTHSESEAMAAIERLNRMEITTAFIGFGSNASNIAKKLGFKNELNVQSSASELRRAFNCLSTSIIEHSKSDVTKTNDLFEV